MEIVFILSLIFLGGLRKWDNWGAMFLVLCVFAIDTGLGNVYKVVGSEDYVKIGRAHV